MIIYQGKSYLEKEHIDALKEEPEYVRKRYQAVARTLSPGPFRITRKAAAEMLRLSRRQMQRIVKRYPLEAFISLPAAA